MNSADTLQGLIPGANGNGTLTAFDFAAIGLGISALTLQNVILLDSSGMQIADTLVNGSVIVQRTTTVPEPATLGLLGLGLVGMGVARRKRAASDYRYDGPAAGLL